MGNNVNNNLKPMAISELLEYKFFIRHYQRGYRWTDQQVVQLLDDIDSFNPREVAGKPNEKTFYCLQPVVVKQLSANSIPDRTLEGKWHEVIDGQQRLTTIYLILHYINEFWTGRTKGKVYDIDYETREDCVKFLGDIKVNEDDISVDINKENIDFYHISKAYESIRNWQLNYEKLHEKKLDDAAFKSNLLSYSKIIWYEVDESESSEPLFERLNLGKIPLTNAELTKALFLTTESFSELGTEEQRIKHFEIALLWDEIEHKLNDQDMKFWSFITNKKRELYDTKIELILDLISEKSDDEKDPLYTFLIFSKNKNNKSLSQIWSLIEKFYYTLIEWNNNRDLYHYIGYLITSKEVKNYKKVKLNDLVQYSMQNSKIKFKELIISQIKDSVAFEISELRYAENPAKLFNVLLLFNVETYRKSKNIDDFYPFKQHKSKSWSLEHIHASNSDGLDQTKQEQWTQWFDLHLPVLKDLQNSPNMSHKSEEIEDVISLIDKFNNPQLTWLLFEDIFNKINNMLTDDTERMDIESDGISNLALLSQPDNSALNSSAFEIKRREIIKLDKKGSFIPICTRRVFMKYYQNSENQIQNYFWSPDDREAYYSELKKTLKDYLSTNKIEDVNCEN
ncbi:MAG: hypothetical protein B6229_00040 [Spirochaetaceae bacterium 4572_7]|nr:MAG: hypothetical protein B6229_00040 [Spirochaetaceae bacterium 4572_7]